MTKVKRIGQMSFRMEVKDPFIISIHHKDFYPKGNGKGAPVEYIPNRVAGADFDENAPWRMYHGDIVPGFPVHPHRGFETVTVMVEGFADHFDSKGSKGRYGEGDVQWMTAGAGAQHSEMFPLIHSDKENTMELFQIWLNLPSKNKLTEPGYKMLWNEKIPIVTEKNAERKTTQIKIIAGKYKETEAIKPLSKSWAYEPENKVNIWIIDMEPGASFVLPQVSPTIGRMLYAYEGGSVELEGVEVTHKHFAELSGNDEIHINNGSERTKLLLLEGEPIGEPVASYGPFVMNNRDELTQAFDEYEKTHFGGWPWDSNDPINPIDSGRFASYKFGEVVEMP